MNITKGQVVLATVVATLGITASCASAAGGSDQRGVDAPELSEPERRPGMDFPLDGVSSICDQFGNRVYRFWPYTSSGAGGIYVVPNDCAK